MIAAHQRPDHATIARFVVRHERALGEVRALCADAGLATVGVIAIDGTKVAANANRDHTMEYKQRAQLAEPIFGDTRHNRRFDRFRRRGRLAARTEWRLMATTHNLLKLHQHFIAAVA